MAILFYTNDLYAQFAHSDLGAKIEGLAGSHQISPIVLVCGADGPRRLVSDAEDEPASALVGDRNAVIEVLVAIELSRFASLKRALDRAYRRTVIPQTSECSMRHRHDQESPARSTSC